MKLKSTLFLNAKRRYKGASLNRRLSTTNGAMRKTRHLKLVKTLNDSAVAKAKERSKDIMHQMKFMSPVQLTHRKLIALIS